MSKTDEVDIIEALLAAHRRGLERAREVSIRTGVPMVVSGKNGKIIKIKPKYKYVLVPIKPKKKRA